MFGGYDNWFYNTLAGIRPDPSAPGFGHFFMEPHPIPGLAWVTCHHDSPHGRIVSAWRDDAGTFVWDVTVPPGTHATAKLPYSRNVVDLTEGNHRLVDGKRDAT
jgi:alpha-L-rhamnosidase